MAIVLSRKGGGGGGSSSLPSSWTTAVSVTAAEFKNLVAVPKVLVSAPGAGLIVVPLQAVLSYTPGIAYVGASWLGLGYAGAAGNATPWIFFSAIADFAAIVATIDFMENRGAQSVVTSQASNQALVLTNNNGVDMTVGTGTAKVWVQYVTITL